MEPGLLFAPSPISSTHWTSEMGFSNTDCLVPPFWTRLSFSLVPYLWGPLCLNYACWSPLWDEVPPTCEIQHLSSSLQQLFSNIPPTRASLPTLCLRTACGLSCLLIHPCPAHFKVLFSDLSPTYTANSMLVCLRKPLRGSRTGSHLSLYFLSLTVLSPFSRCSLNFFVQCRNHSYLLLTVLWFG